MQITSKIKKQKKVIINQAKTKYMEIKEAKTDEIENIRFKTNEEKYNFASVNQYLRATLTNRGKEEIKT